MTDQEMASVPLLSPEALSSPTDGAAAPAAATSAAVHVDDQHQHVVSDGESSDTSNSSFDDLSEIDGTNIDLLTDDQRIQMIVLSRVVERYRFLIPSERVDDLVTEDTLLWMFTLDLEDDEIDEKSLLRASSTVASRQQSRSTSNVSSRRTSRGSSMISNAPPSLFAASGGGGGGGGSGVVSSGGGAASSNASSSNWLGSPAHPAAAAAPAASSGAKTATAAAARSATLPSAAPAADGDEKTATSATATKKKIDLDDLDRTEREAAAESSPTTATPATLFTPTSDPTQPPVKSALKKKIVLDDDDDGDSQQQQKPKEQQDDDNSKSAAEDASKATAAAARWRKVKFANMVAHSGPMSAARKSILNRRMKEAVAGDDATSASPAAAAAAGTADASSSIAQQQQQTTSRTATAASMAAAAALFRKSQAAAAGAPADLETTSNVSSVYQQRHQHPSPQQQQQQQLQPKPGARSWRKLRERTLAEVEDVIGQQQEEDSNSEFLARHVNNTSENPQQHDDDDDDDDSVKLDASAILNATTEGARKTGRALRTGLFRIGGLAIESVRALKEGVRDSVRDVANNVRNVATDLGIVEKKKSKALMLLAADLWKRCRSVKTSFRTLLEFDNECFPYTTERQRRIIRRFASEEESDDKIIDRDMLAWELNIEADDAILRCLFGELQELPRIVYSRVVSCLHDHPHKHSFAKTCAEKTVDAKKNMSLMFSYVLMFIITLVIIPQLDIPSMFLVQRSAWDAATGEFPSSCPDGVQNITCFTIRKTIDDVRTRYDVEQYAHNVIVRELWPEDGVTRASEDTFFGNIRVGALLMKVSPMEDASSARAQREAENAGAAAAVCPVRSCGELNLSQTTDEFLVSSVFSCAAFAGSDGGPNSTSVSAAIVVIPFNTTRGEAEELAKSFRPDYCEEETVQATIQFALFQPSQQILSWTTISFTVPAAGSVIPRTFTATMNLRAKPLVRAFAGIHLSIFAWLFLAVIFRRREGWARFFTLQLVSEYVLSGINVATLVLIESLPTIEEILASIVQASYVPPSIDQSVTTYAAAMDLLAVWTLIFYLMSTLLFSSVIGLNVITHLLRITAADVTVLLVLFLVYGSVFLLVARVLFGFASAEFSFTPTTFQFFLRFLWGEYDFSSITVVKQSPVAGAVFIFGFLLFVLILLNLLVAAVTSRLDELRERANLHLEVFAAMASDAANFIGASERTFFPLRKLLFPFVSAVVDAIPVISSTTRWTQFYRITTELFGHQSREEPCSLEALVHAGCELVDMCAEAAPALAARSRYMTALATRKQHQRRRRRNNNNNNSNLTEEERAKRERDEKEEEELLNSSTADHGWTTALRRAVDTYEPIKDKNAWLLIERVILIQSRQNIVRDAALIRTLIAYDEDFTDIDRVVEFQREQEHLCLERRQRLATGVSKHHEAWAANWADETVTQKFQLSASQSVFEPSASFGAFPPPSSSSSSAAAAAAVAAAAAAPPAAAVAASSASASAASTSSGVFTADGQQQQQQRQQMMRKRGQSHAKVKANAQVFLTNQYILRYTKAHLWQPLKSLVTLVLYLGFFFSLLLYSEPSTFLGENLQRGLVDYPFVQSCSDANCTEAFLFQKRFGDIGNNEDIAQYFRKLLIPKVFPTAAELPYDKIPDKFAADEASGASHAVWWDAHIRRTSPVFVRQVRAQRIPCELPRRADIARYGDPARARVFETLECFRPAGIFETFDQSPLARPLANESEKSPLADSAYAHQSSCPEGAVVLGNFDLYDCGGFIAEVHNASQLEFLMDTAWLDSSARLVVISAEFMSTYEKHKNPAMAGRVLRTRIDLYVEMAAGGGGASVWSYVNVGDQPMFSKFAWIGFVLLGIDIGFYVLHFTRYTFYRMCSRKQDLTSAEMHRPEMPAMSVLALIACVTLASATSLQPQLAQSWMLAVLVVSSTTSLMYDVVFPLAKVITFRAAYLIRSLTLAVQLVLVIIPFYLTMTVGFTISAHMMFGRNTLEMSTMRLTVQTIGRGLLMDFGIETLYKQRPFAAVAFALVFFACILVVLSNILLTIILSAVTEAKAETRIVSYISTAAEFYNETVLTDEAVATYLAWHLQDDSHFLKRAYRFASEKLASLFRRKEDEEDDDDGDDGAQEKQQQPSQQSQQQQPQPLTGDASLAASTSGDTSHSAGSSSTSPATSPNSTTTAAVLKQHKKAKRKNVKEISASHRRDRTGGSFFVTHDARFARPLEALMFVSPIWRLSELAEALHVTELPSSMLYSVALFLARTQMAFQRKFPDMSTLDDAHEARLHSRFRDQSASAVFARQAAGPADAEANGADSGSPMMGSPQGSPLDI